MSPCTLCGSQHPGGTTAPPSDIIGSVIAKRYNVGARATAESLGTSEDRVANLGRAEGLTVESAGAVHPQLLELGGRDPLTVDVGGLRRGEPDDGGTHDRRIQ
jgi:hypothetical protein